MDLQCIGFCISYCVDFLQAKPKFFICKCQFSTLKAISEAKSLGINYLDHQNPGHNHPIRGKNSRLDSQTGPVSE